MFISIEEIFIEWIMWKIFILYHFKDKFIILMFCVGLKLCVDFYLYKTIKSLFL